MSADCLSMYVGYVIFSTMCLILWKCEKNWSDLRDNFIIDVGLSSDKKVRMLAWFDLAEAPLCECSVLNSLKFWSQRLQTTADVMIACMSTSCQLIFRIKALETHIAFHCTNALCPPCDMHPLCFANPETYGAQRWHVPHITFVQPLLAKSWTCHQSMSAGSPVKQQKITENFRAPERLG